MVLITSIHWMSDPVTITSFQPKIVENTLLSQQSIENTNFSESPL